MEKNTKIILGLAAVGVVAYLVLKPPVKSETSDADLKQMEEEIKNGNPRMSGTCPEGYTYNSLAGCIKDA
jgi:hypothetical protein